MQNLIWAYAITPNYAWFDSFAADLSGRDISIITDLEDAQPSQYLWSSRHLNDCANIAEVHNRAAALKALFDGALLLEDQLGYLPLRFEALIDLRTETRHPAQPGDFLTQPFSAAQVQRSADKRGSGYFVDRAIFHARGDAATRELLMFLGVNGATWISLYAVLDTLRRNGWDDKIITANTKATTAEIGRFKHTANNSAAIGPLARHGDQGWAPPSKPMLLHEAAHLVLPIAKAFIASRMP